MAKAPPKAGKSESLTIRLDPKTRFILEYVSKLKGQTITTVVERAIHRAALDEKVPDYTFGGDLSWHDFWDVSDGVRALRMASRKEFFPTYEEDKKLTFCKEHWPFFWSSKERTSFLNYYVDVLWPRIDEFVQMHDDMKATDYFAAGREMQKALSTAKLKAPDWPIVQKPKTLESPKPSLSMDDDDIPF